MYLNAPTKDFSRLANAVITAVREKQISVLRIESYQFSYHFIAKQENYTLNPFLDIVRKTYKDTRSEYTSNTTVLDFRFVFSEEKT